MWSAERTFGRFKKDAADGQSTISTTDTKRSQTHPWKQIRI